MRLQVLDKVHEGHQPNQVQRTCKGFYLVAWSQPVQDMVENCKVCAKYRQLQAKPIMPTSFPERPWQMIATDLFELDKLNYLIVVDYFSRYIKVAAMQKTSKSLEVIEVIESNVHKTWNPRRSDNGPQYPSAEFTNFAKEWGFKHITSSPCFPQSISEVERAVETIKSLLKKEKDPSKGLSGYRSTHMLVVIHHQNY